MNCIICNKNKETRLGVCYDCAEAESIIHDSTDMYDIGMEGEKINASTAANKLKYLIEKGWVYNGLKPQKKT